MKTAKEILSIREPLLKEYNKIAVDSIDGDTEAYWSRYMEWLEEFANKTKPYPSDEDNEALRDRYQDETELSVWSEEIYNDVGFSDKYVKWLENKVLINSPLPSDEVITEIARFYAAQLTDYESEQEDLENAFEAGAKSIRDNYQPQTKEVDYKDAIRKLLTGLECQQIEMFISKSKINDYLKLGIAYSDAVKQKLNK